MSKPSCDACSNLREYNANFIMNGVTDDIAASLANNTGLNACLTDLHTDCEDLNDVNDCLIGHMDDDVDNYEVCDWKSLAHNFFPNLYETLKATIASICGLWTKTTYIENQIEIVKKGMCNIITPNWVTVPFSVGTHYYDTDEYWATGGNFGIVRFTIATAEITQCDGSTVYAYRPSFGVVDGSRGQLNKSIDGDAVVCELKRSEVVPTYMSNDCWNAILKRRTINGELMSGDLCEVCSMGRTSTIRTSFNFLDEDTFTVRIQGYVGSDTTGGVSNIPIYPFFAK